MAKQISQETFDSVVKENIEEFEMTPEEAVEDAVKQFETQGINLENIVKDLSIRDGANGDTNVSSTHAVVDAIQSLSKALAADDLSQEEVAKQCSIIETECNIDLAHRCLASSNNAYNVLFDACTKLKDTQVFLACLQAMCSLCNGQPDVLDIRGTIFLVEQLSVKEHSPKVVAALVKLIRLTCVKHEKNRQGYVTQNVIPTLVQVLESHRNEAEIVKEVCFALRVLTFDDDMRVPFGKAHEHAKMIVTEADALSKILRICKDYVHDKSVLGELFLTLSRLAVRNEFCQEIMELGGLELMLGALEKSMDHQGIVLQAMKVLKAIAGNDQVKIAIVKSGGLLMILEAVAKHHKNAAVCEAGCAAITTIVLRNPDHCKVVMQGGGAEVLTKCMILHPSHEAVQKQACMAIRNLVARTRDNSGAFLELGAEDLIRRTLATYKNCHDEAQAALRDLGCNVELKCLWTGEGKGIHA